jgi:hypothetical protein
MAVIRDRLSTAGDQARRGRSLARPSDARRGRLGVGNRAEAARLLLVSRHSLSSDYVVDKEIEIVRERQAKGEAVHFYPLILTPTPRIALDLVRDKNLRPRDGKPLSDYSITERYRHMNEAADEIAEISSNIPKRELTARSLGRSPLSRPIHRTTNEGLAPQSSQPSRGSATIDVTDLASLESWMTAGGNRVAAKLAARAVLRALPILVFDVPHQPSGLSKPEGELVVSAIFRAASLAQFSGFVPPNVDVLRAWPEAAEAAAVLAASIHSSVAAGVTRAAASAARSAGSSVGADAGALGAQAVSDAVEAMSTAVRSNRIDVVRAVVWESVRDDALDAENIEATAFARLPLWKGQGPPWVNDGWLHLQSYLPRDHDWQIWIEWYEDRLRGGWRGEAYEHVFVNVPKEEWDKGPAAANLWIKAHLPPPSDGSVPEITDEKSLSVWLNTQGREVVVAIAARAALRSVPLIAYRPTDEIGSLACAVFRATAMALIAAKYPTRIDKLRDAARAAAEAAKAVEGAGAASAAIEASLDADATTAALLATEIAAGEVNVLAYNMTVKAGNDPSAAVAAGDTARASFWEAIFLDATAAKLGGAAVLASIPLWSAGRSPWLDSAWFTLLSALPNGQDWEIWFDWYEQRQRGGSHGEEYELVFASVPQEEWDKSPAAANAWIKAHLPKVEATRSVELPESVAGVEAPFNYSWTASQRVAVVSGAQNLPFYAHFSSEEDHRHALEAARVGGGRLLKALRDGRYNARKEYGEALGYYLNDLPKVAGAGNILLANDQARILHAMFLPMHPCCPRASPAGSKASSPTSSL